MKFHLGPPVGIQFARSSLGDGPTRSVP